MCPPFFPTPDSSKLQCPFFWFSDIFKATGKWLTLLSYEDFYIYESRASKTFRCSILGCE